MLQSILLTGLILVGTAGAAFAKSSAEEFVKKAAMGGMMEVQAGQIALERVRSDDLRAFAEEMVTDHQAANEKLKAIAAEEGIEVPTELDEKHLQELEKLQSAENFEREYLKMQIEDHDKDIELFQTYIEEGDNAALKRFAEETLPTLKEHKGDVTALGSAQALN